MFVPTPKAFDGSPTGNSYITQWLTCRRKWFARYLWPHEDGSVGLEIPRSSIRLGTRGLMGGGANRMLGSLLHAYKEAWYKSGIRDGEDTGQYDHDAASAAMVDYLTARSEEFETPEAAEWARANVLSWCEAFHRFYGPEGHTPLWPHEKVLTLDDGRPAVELEFGVPLGVYSADGKEYVYTCRYDAIALWEDRYLLVLEHKTAAPSWAERYVSRLPKSSQFTGEMFVLRYHPQLKDLPWDKIRVAYHLKGWSAKSTFPVPVVFGDTTRTPDQLARFRMRVIVALTEIDHAVNIYRTGMQAGTDPAVLRDELFPETGEHTGDCYAFNSVCDFEGPCRLGFGPGTLGGFRSARRPTDPPPFDADVEGE